MEEFPGSRNLRQSVCPYCNRPVNAFLPASTTQTHPATLKINSFSSFSEISDILSSGEVDGFRFSDVSQSLRGFEGFFDRCSSLIQKAKTLECLCSGVSPHLKQDFLLHLALASTFETMVMSDWFPEEEKTSSRWDSLEALMHDMLCERKKMQLQRQDSISFYLQSLYLLKRKDPLLSVLRPRKADDRFMHFFTLWCHVELTLSRKLVSEQQACLHLQLIFVRFWFLLLLHAIFHANPKKQNFNNSIFLQKLFCMFPISKFSEFDISISDLIRIVKLALIPWLVKVHWLYRFLFDPSHRCPLVGVEEPEREYQNLLMSLPAFLRILPSIEDVFAEESSIFDHFIDLDFLEIFTDLPGEPLAPFIYIKKLALKQTILPFSREQFPFKFDMAEDELSQFLYVHDNKLLKVDIGEQMLAIGPFLPTTVLGMAQGYQRLYSQFVNCRCVNCGKTPKSPFICFTCGALLCCNDNCCKSTNIHGVERGEVSDHVAKCTFASGSLVLQLESSVLHLVMGGYVAHWGSIYVDLHGEEQHSLSKPAWLSPARLKMACVAIREHTHFWGHSARINWKKIVRI